MRQRRVWVLALGVLVVAGLVGAELIEADGPGATPPIQNEAFVSILDGDVCSSITTLYSVPAGRRLIIEWIAIESNALTLADPVDIDVEVDPGSGAVLHPVVRLDDSVNIATSFFFSQRWSSNVRLYATGGTDVRAQACRNGTTDDHSVRITWSGKLSP